MSVILDILIPTYNRAEALAKNLSHLDQQISKYDLSDQVRIIVSDNASTDPTLQIAAQFKDKCKSSLVYSRQETNIGLEANMVSILRQATAPYIMWTGDDDYVADGYIKFCLDKLQSTKDLGVVIPGLSSLHQDGSVTAGRVEDFDEKELTAGYTSAWTYSHLAHQMSGLTMRREGLIDAYLRQEQYRNPYLFIFLTTHLLLNHPSYYAPKYSTAVSVFNEKDWGYNQVGLLDEVFKSYLAFVDKIGEANVCQLLLRFSVLHSYRYDIRWNQPLRLIKKYRSLIRTTPDLPGFRKGLKIQLLKDYILSFRL